MGKEINIALISPSKNAFSETFIQMHKEGIRGNVVYYYHGEVPRKNNIEKEFLIKFQKLFFYIKVKLGLSKLSSLEHSFYTSFKKNDRVILVVEFGTTTACVLKVCKLLKTSLIPIFHGFDASIYEVIDQYKEIFEDSRKIMVVSEVISTNLMVLGCLKEKIVVNPWAPDDFFFSLTPQFKEPLLLAVGRFVDKKAPYYTILAYIKVVKKYLKAKLHFIGKGELDNVCKNLLKYCNLQESILFLGVLNSNEIAEYFQRALVFVQHSIIADNGDSEGTPLSILEASAAGIPIIFYKHKGIIDVLDDEVSGFLVEEYDVF